jgi:3-(3-hydroxy-phenyl)propionate hydroxylase
MPSRLPDPARPGMRREHGHHQVIIVGGGPTGMLLAAELAIAGVDVALVERRTAPGQPGTRALGLMPRAIETLDLRGIGDRFVAAGQTYPSLNFHVPLDISGFPTRRNYLLGLPQNEVEALLDAWIRPMPIAFRHGRRATAVVAHDGGARVTLDDGSALTAEYVVGCDGGRSLVRKSAGIAFEGWPASTSWITAELKARMDVPLGFHVDQAGQQHVIVPGDTAGYLRLVLVEHAPDLAREPDLDAVRRSLRRAYGADFGVHDPVWLSRFTDMARQATTYRAGRMLIAGDAAHVHAPLGGQGLGIGLQDAMNLGWKLARVVRGQCPEALLDTYTAERHPVAARVLQNTMALSALRCPDPHAQALARYVSEYLRLAEPGMLMAAELSGLGTAYAQEGGHLLAGRRMPDAPLQAASGPRHAYDLLHAGRPVLLHLDTSPAPSLQGWQDRVTRVSARLAAPLVLPVIGEVETPACILVRPDGYVAWAGDPQASELGSALAAWFGPAAP